jgi:hypothetical protein
MVDRVKQPDRALIAALAPFMEQHGFSFMDARKVYLRKREYGFDDFSWSAYPLATGPKWMTGYYEGTHGIGLRSDAVTEIYEVLGWTVGVENRRYRPTIYRGMGNFFPFNAERDRQLFLRFDHLNEDVAETAKRMSDMLMGDGFAWFERYADPVELSQGLNDPVSTSGTHALLNNSDHRPLVGVAAACVAEPDRVSSLIEAYMASAKGDDERFKGKRDPVAPSLAKDFTMLTARARELGYMI